ncbi:hypothetical protein VYU27_008026 [Nannochloropsis oceanica]
MGTGMCGKKPRHSAKKKQYKKALCTARRPKDVDQIQDELRKEVELGAPLPLPYDDDLPGGGQFYCRPCARHFGDQHCLDHHIKSKVHKRRMKDVAQEQYSQGEAEYAAGMTKEVLPPAHSAGLMVG